MKRIQSLLSLRLFGPVLCGLLVSSCSQEAPTEVTPQSLEVVTDHIHYVTIE